MAKKKRDAKRKTRKEKKGEARAVKEISKKEYEKALAKLQIELVKLQEWVKHKGLKVVVIFEGRDAAGKGGVQAHHAVTEPAHLSHRRLGCANRTRKNTVVLPALRRSPACRR